MSKRAFRRLASLAVTASAAISAVRVLVLFFESYSTVAAERSADAKLLELCQSEETAAASQKFQNACVAARAAGAAPILLKSLIHACHTVLTDTLELFNSPTRVVVVVLLVISGVSAPLVRLLFVTLVAGMRTRREEEQDDEEEEQQRTIVRIAPDFECRPSPWAIVKHQMHARVGSRLAAKLHED